MKRKVTKWMAGISSAAMLVSFSALSVPAFAAEYEAMEAEAYVASFANADETTQKVAQYFVDNAGTLDEAMTMMDQYMDGLALIESKKNASTDAFIASTNSTKPAYYSGNSFVPTTHGGVFIVTDTNVDVDASLEVDWNQRENQPLSAVVNYDTTQKPKTVLNNSCFESVRFSVIDDKTVRVNFSIYANGSSKPAGVLKFPYEVTATSEVNVYNAFRLTIRNSDPIGGSSNTDYYFHTYAFGDVDHDGVLTNADYVYTSQACVGAVEFDYSFRDVAPDIAEIVSKQSMDVNQDGVVDIRDGILVGKLVNGES